MLISSLDYLFPSPLRLLSILPWLETEPSPSVTASAVATSSISFQEGSSNQSSAIAYAASNGTGSLLVAAASAGGQTSQQVIYIPNTSSGMSSGASSGSDVPSGNATAPLENTSVPPEENAAAPEETAPPAQENGTTASEIEGSTTLQADTAIALAFSFFSREESTGNLLGWTLDSELTATAKTINGNLLDASWSLEVLGDFNGDGQADILLQHNEGLGESIIWHLGGPEQQITSEVTINRQFTDTNLDMVGALQLNGDGQADLLLYDQMTGEAIVWYLDGAGHVIEETFLGRKIDDGWRMVATADFDGDGQKDILLNHAASGQLLVWQMKGIEIESEYLINQTLDSSYSIQGASDLNGDSQADLLLHHGQTGVYSAWFIQAGQLQGEATIQGLTELNSPLLV